MQVVKTVGEYKVIKKRSGRYGVLAKGRKWISGDDKVRVLDEAGLIAVPTPKPEPVEEPAEAVAEEAAPKAEAAAEDDAGEPEEKAE